MAASRRVVLLALAVGCGAPGAEGAGPATTRPRATEPAALSGGVCDALAALGPSRNESLDAEGIRALSRAPRGDALAGEAAVAALESALAGCQPEWSRLEELGWSEEAEGAGCGSEWAPPWSSPDLERLWVQRDGDLLRAGVLGCGDEEGNCELWAARFWVPSCRWIDVLVTWNPCSQPAGRVRLDTGGRPELEAVLRDELPRHAGDASRPSDGLSFLLALGGVPLDVDPEAIPSPCPDGWCVGPAWRLPPWRDGEPSATPRSELLWRRGEGLVYVAQQTGEPSSPFAVGPFVGRALPLTRRAFWCGEAYVVHDPQRGRHRWLGGHLIGTPVDPSSGSAAPSVGVHANRYVQVGPVFVDLDAGRGALVFPDRDAPMTPDDARRIGDALARGRCDVGCDP